MTNTVLTTRALLLAALPGVLAGCDNEPPARSVAEFMENPILLEAAVVRCAQNRAETRYDAECVNAREAIKIIEAREEAERRAELEAMSEKKRQALRRTQRAAAEARRRADEDRRRREESAYLAQFGEAPPENTANTDQGAAGSNAPAAVLPDPPPTPASTAPKPITSPYDNPVAEAPPAQAPASESSAAAQSAPPEQAQPADLEAIREELKRRNEDGS